MTVPEVAKFLLLDVSTIYKYLKNGKMDNDKVISMLRYKFNRHYGYDVETKQENEVDYKGIVKELKELYKQMQTINKAIETKEANLKRKLCRKEKRPDPMLKMEGKL